MPSVIFLYSKHTFRFLSPCLRTYGLIRIQNLNLWGTFLSNVSKKRASEFLETIGELFYHILGLNCSYRREPFFPSLAALIHQHSHRQLALPVKLNIPLLDLTEPNVTRTSGKNYVDNRSARPSAEIFCTHYLYETGKTSIFLTS